MPQDVHGDYPLRRVKTVETYRARIGDTLGLKSRADLVRFALDAGVLVPRFPRK